MAFYLSASEAAYELGVSVATLYAYVSRGMIRSESRPGSRNKLYRADDVRALRARHVEEPRSNADPFIPSGLESHLTLISNGRLFYRGLDVEELAQHATLETAATLLWGQEADDAFAIRPTSQVRPAKGALMSRMSAGLIRASEFDAAAHDHSPGGTARTGARILHHLVALATQSRSQEHFIHAAVATAWGCAKAAEIVRTALVVGADHELATSTAAVRITASTGASPYQAVASGLACLSGPLCAGLTERVANMLDEIGKPEAAERALIARLRRGEDLPGFGGGMYSDIDPRARALLLAIRSFAPSHPALALSDAVIDTVGKLTRQQPTYCYAMVCACRVAGLPPEAPLALISISRAAGWIAHIIEQYSAPKIPRFRARYVGALPT